MKSARDIVPNAAAQALLIAMCLGGATAPAGAAQDAAATQETIGSKPDARTLNSYHPFEFSGDLTAWAQRSADRRRQLLVSTGMWALDVQSSRAPVQATIHGRIERAGYTVEKVYLDARMSSAQDASQQDGPEFHVTGSLYRPTTAGPHAGVLVPHGHWTNGRFCERSDADTQAELDAQRELFSANARYHLQARCAQLARMGCVVLHYDMTGYADSQQLPHSQGFTDEEALREGWSALGVQTWSSLRALDFLCELPDVDTDRIGMTGASGGGTQTFILAALDERIDAAFPAVMIGTAMQGGCKCENAPHLRVGTGNVEFAALAAPRPYALTGANDWTIDIMTKGLPQLKSLWGALGHAENVAAWCYPEFPHNYNVVSRGHMYAWFNEHLALGQSSPIVEQELIPIPPRELSVYDEEHPRPAADGVLASLRKDWGAFQMERVGQLQSAPSSTATQQQEPRSRTARRAAERAAHEESWRRTLAQLLHTGPAAPGTVKATVLDSASTQQRRVLQLHVERDGSGELLPATLILPDDWTGIMVVALSPGGRADWLADGAAPAVNPEAVLAQGCAFLTGDLWLCGEAAGMSAEERATALRKAKQDTQRHGDYAGYSYGYNRTLVAERVHDALTLISFARDYECCTAVNLIGTGAAGAWALMARSVAPQLLSFTAAQWSQDFFDVGLEDPSFLPGAVGLGGLASFLHAGGEAPVVLWDPGQAASLRSLCDGRGIIVLENAGDPELMLRICGWSRDAAAIEASSGR